MAWYDKFFGNSTVQTIAQGLSDRYLGTNFLSSEEAEKHRQWQEGMMQAQNAYNAPANQMALARQAGLNPSLLYGQPVSTSASPSGGAMASGANGSGDLMTALQQGAFMSSQKALLDAQAELARSQAHYADSQREYQQYMNDIEKQLANSPLREVRITSDDGSEEVHIQYGNARVEIGRRELQSLGIQNAFDNADLNDLLYDIAVRTGVDYYGLTHFAENVPSDTPNYQKETEAFRGSQDIIRASARIQGVAADAAEAEKAGQVEYNKWLKEHENDPVVKGALVIIGIFKSLGITLPTVSADFGNNKSNRRVRIGRR